ncbi:MAG: hypothetical protein ABW106_15780 [Steroidobacteraceae bacterium]
MATKAKRSKQTGSTKGKSAKKVAKKSVKRAKRASGGTLVRWTPADDKTLKQMIKQKISTRVIGVKLKRSEGSVRQHVYKLGLSLK